MEDWNWQTDGWDWADADIVYSNNDARCANCDAGIRVGEKITRSGDAWVHFQCPTRGPTECKHGMDPRDCSLCLHPERKSPYPLDNPSWWIRAEHNTRCANCNSGIIVGEKISRAGDTWVHYSCP